MKFVPGLVAPEGAPDRPSYWFAFHENRLLAAEDGTGVPHLPSLTALGLDPSSIQYLGTADGHPCYSAELPAESAASPASPPPGWSFTELRRLWGSLPEDLFWLAGRAFQIMDWDRTHKYCGRCGTPTETKTDERAKLCPACGHFSFPRVAPAVIVAVTREGKLLLARARRFPTAMYSVIAGFVDPGESLEECAQREVREEVGIAIRNLRYFSSQPWPFPHSLMVAFTAEHAGGEIAIDGKEIVAAGWYTPDGLPLIPDRISVARRLIDWFVASRLDL